MRMFSTNPFPQFPSSPNNVFFPPNFPFDNEKVDYHLNNSDPFISAYCFQDTYNNLAPPSPAVPNITTIKQQQQCFEGLGLESFEDHDDDLLDSVIASCKKRTAGSKKDGHSKIYTARGPRDRRVRLSIDVSRKFFCLQDLLGFDKASKTLDWLFGKCRTAIQELVEETNHYPSSTTTYQSKTSFLEAITVGRDGGKSKKKYVDGKGKNITQKPKGGSQDNLHSRTLARARARERVVEKMRIRKLNDELKTSLHDDFDYQNFKSSEGENHRVISAHPPSW